MRLLQLFSLCKQPRFVPSVRRTILIPSVNTGYAITAKSSIHTSVTNNVSLTSPVSFMPTLTDYAGHSKWQNIRHIKGAKDAKKAAMNSRYAKDISLAIKEGNGANPKFNVQLARVIERAEKDDVPKLTIQNALKRATEGKPRSTHFIDMRGPGNCALIVETFTDSVPRIKNELTTVSKKFGGRLGESNQFFFDKKGVIFIPAETYNFDQAEEIAIEAGAEEVEEEADENGQNVYKLICSDEELFTVKKTLETKNIPIIRYCSDFEATSSVNLSEDAQSMVMKLLDKIETVDDVVKVYDNIEVE